MVHYDALHLGLSFSEIIKRLQNMLLLSLEGVRDITVASHLIGDMSGSTIDDPLSETYNKLGCLISPLEKDSDDYDMIVKYLERTYEPVKVGDMALAQGVLTSYMFTTSARIHVGDVKLINLWYKYALSWLTILRKYWREAIGLSLLSIRPLQCKTVHFTLGNNQSTFEELFG